MEKFDGKERFLFYVSISITFYINSQKNVAHSIAEANCPSLRADERTPQFFLGNLQ